MLIALEKQGHRLTKPWKEPRGPQITRFFYFATTRKQKLTNLEHV